MNQISLYKTNHFNIYNQNEDINVLENIEKELNQTYDLVVDFYNIKMDKTNVYIFNNQVEFQQKKDSKITEENKISWWVGECMNGNILAVSPAIKTKCDWHDYNSILKVISHEFIHVVNNKININCNIWINEGIALFLINGIKLKGILEKYKIPDIKILNNQLNFIEENGYIYSDKLIEYFYKNYGKEKIIELIKNNNYEEVFGKNINIIYEEWIHYINENYA